MGLLSWLSDKKCTKCGKTYNGVTSKDFWLGLCDECLVAQESKEQDSARRKSEAKERRVREYRSQLGELGLQGVCERFARGEPIKACAVAIWDDLSRTNKLDRMASGVAIAIASGGWLSNPPKTHPIGLLAVTDKSLFCVQLGVFEEEAEKLKHVFALVSTYQIVYVDLDKITATRNIEDNCCAVLEITGAARMRFVLSNADEFDPNANPLFKILGDYNFKTVSHDIEKACNA